MGTVIGAWTLFYGVGAVLVHWVTGILRDRTGIYDYPFMICTGMALFAILLIFPLKKPKQKQLM
jgi:sugar phosphate permease